MTVNPISLWDFSLKLYAQPLVEQTCLQLQDHWRANSNVLLWSCWLEQRYISLDAEKIVRASTRLDEWDNTIVTPLRTMRRAIKQQFPQCDDKIESSRQAIKVAELAAERVEQAWLEQMVVDWQSEDAAIATGANLAVYLRSLDVPDVIAAAAIAAITATL